MKKRNDIFPFSEFDIDVYEIYKNETILLPEISWHYNSENFEDNTHLYTGFSKDD